MTLSRHSQETLKKAGMVGRIIPGRSVTPNPVVHDSD